MRTVLVIGIGMGEPEGLTARAVEAIGAAGVFFLLDKSEGAGELVAARESLIARLARPGHRVVRAPSPPRRPAPIAAAPDEGARARYEAAVADWHAARAALLAGLIASEIAEDGTGALLVWGDPMLYDSTLRVLEAARAHAALGGGPGFALRVIPGITALQALCAAHAIPLNAIGEAVRLTTGRNLAGAVGETVTGETGAAATFAVLLDDGAGLAALLARGWPGHVWWGANLGTPAERLLSGPLVEIGAEILRIRAEIRVARGWVMDVWVGRGPPI
ncbi:precorrin-6A synthase (deacetylating) [Ancylobacter sp. TS-1]|uniref:precorrin-6A synthase (deacetylating) n=1 Tax=Ancylobacter sp. TS-1 TaxID=1850374 RepID=UPI001265BFC6|nr:precorrin-6A synthase (deacetylating) [Ancylobacter sp. TS-1]QFR33984.1 precorrin-6A synthase (deacetylating) [Ancylobacter sp. TS-1]